MATGSFTANQERSNRLRIELWKGRRVVFSDYIRAWMAGVLFLADMFSLVSAIYLASQIRQLPGLIVTPAYLRIFGLLALTLVIMFARKGLYPAVGLTYFDELGQIVSSASFTFLVMLAITFMLKTSATYSRLVLLLSWLLALAFIPASRYLVRRLLIRWGLWGEPVVVIGDEKKARPLAEHFRINLQLGLRPVAVLPDDRCNGCTLSASTEDTICTIRARAREFSLKTALVLVDDLNEIDRLVERFNAIFHRVILIKEKNGSYGLTGLEYLDFSNVLGLQVKNNLLNPWSQALKRLMDVLVSFFGMALLSPLLGLVALSIVLDNPGRVFYRQTRLGRGGRPFRLIKFRTMYQGADRILAGKLASDPALKEEWDCYQKLKDDPRLTRVGRLLRRFSLDELPQLWNIARGEMSLVGPRPMMPDQRALYGEAFGYYTRVTPGITGLWQVSGRNQTTFARRAELDNEYIQSWSIWLDIFILVKTVKVVFWRDGAY